MVKKRIFQILVLPLCILMVLSEIACSTTKDDTKTNESTSSDNTSVSTEQTSKEETTEFLIDPAPIKSKNGYFGLDIASATINQEGEIFDEINIFLTGRYLENAETNDWFGIFPASVSSSSVSESDSIDQWAYVRRNTDGILQITNSLFSKDPKKILPPGSYQLFLCRGDSYQVIDEIGIDFILVECQPMKAIEEYGDVLYSFNLVSDMHYQTSYCFYESHIKSALENMKKYNPQAEFILSVGDQTDGGRKAQFNFLYKMYTNSGVKIPFFLSVGNHERMNVDFATLVTENYLRFGNIATDKTYYSFESNNSVFFVLGTENHSTNDGLVFISQTQYNWFVNGFNKAKNEGKLVFVVHHEPFANTVAGSYAEQGWQANQSQDDGNYFDKLQEICDSYHNCFVFTGHSHWSAISKNNALVSNGERANYLNCSSVGYLWYGAGAGYTKNDQNNMCTGGEEYFVYVFSDQVVIRSWDIDTDSFIMDFVFPLQ